MALNVSFLTEQWEKELYAGALYGALLWAKSLTPDKKKKMYIQASNDKQAMISRKLYKRLGRPSFIHISRVKGKDSFIIIPMSKADAENIVCSPVIPFKDNRRTPAAFCWTIPSLEYFKTVTGINLVTSKIIKVNEIKVNDKTYFQLCTD